MKRLLLKHSEELALLDILEHADLSASRMVLSKLIGRIRGREAERRKHPHLRGAGEIPTLPA